MLTLWNDDFGRSYLGLNQLRRDMDRLLEGFERGWPAGVGFGRDVASSPWTGADGGPVVSLTDGGAHFTMRAELPGFRDEDIDVTVEQSTVTLRGHREIDPPEGYAQHRRERAAVDFARSFTLPCRVDAESAKAALANGVLTLTLPKRAEEQPKKVQVRASK